MRQQVIYSMLAMAAVPAVSMAQVQVNEDEAIAPITQGTAVQALTTQGITLNTTQLAIGTYKITFGTATPDGMTLNGATVTAGSYEATVELTQPGDIVAAGTGDITITKAVVKFPQECVNYAIAFTDRYNNYGDANDPMAIAMRQVYSTDAAKFLINGGFNTYDNYVAMEMWNGVDELKTAGDALQKDIAQYMLDQVLPAYQDALQALNDAIADAEQKLLTLNDNDAAAEALAQELQGYKDQRDDLEKEINKMVYGEEVTNENLSETPQFTGTDEAFNFLKDGTETEAVNQLAQTVENNMEQDIQDAKDAYTQFTTVQSWKNEALDSLAEATTLFNTLVEEKKIDITKNGDVYTFPNTFTADSAIKAMTARIEEYFNSSKTAEAPDVQAGEYTSIGYRYYKTTEWDTWYNDGAAYNNDFKVKIINKLKDIVNMLNQGAQEYADTVSALATALNKAVGTPYDLDDVSTGDVNALGGAYRLYKDSIGKTSPDLINALNFKAVDPSKPNEPAVDIYEDWRKAAADSLDNMRKRDSLIFDKLAKAYAAGEVGTRIQEFQGIDSVSAFKDVLFAAENDDPFFYNEEEVGYAVKADTINTVYKQATEGYSKLITELENYWATVPDTVKAEWSGEVRGADKGLDSLYAKLHNLGDTGLLDTLKTKYNQAAFDSLKNHTMFHANSIFNHSNQESEYNQKLNLAKGEVDNFIEKCKDAILAFRQYHWIADSTLDQKVLIDTVARGVRTDEKYDSIAVWMVNNNNVINDSIEDGKIGNWFDGTHEKYAEDFDKLDSVSIVEKHLSWMLSATRQKGALLVAAAKAAYDESAAKMDSLFKAEVLANTSNSGESKMWTAEWYREQLKSEEAIKAHDAVVDSIKKCADEWYKVDAALNPTMKESTDPSVVYKGKTYAQNLELIKQRIVALIDSVAKIDANASLQGDDYILALKGLLTNAPADSSFSFEVADTTDYHFGIRWDLAQLLKGSAESKEAFDISQYKIFYNNKRSDLASRILDAKARVDKVRHDYLEDGDSIEALGGPQSFLVSELTDRANDLWMPEQVVADSGLTQNTSALAKLDTMLLNEDGSYGYTYINGVASFGQWKTYGETEDVEGVGYVRIADGQNGFGTFKLGFDAKAPNRLRVTVTAKADQPSELILATKGDTAVVTMPDTQEFDTYTEDIILSAGNDLTAEDTITLKIKTGISVTIKSVEVALAAAQDETQEVFVQEGTINEISDSTETFVCQTLPNNTQADKVVQIKLTGKAYSGEDATYQLIYVKGDVPFTDASKQSLEFTVPGSTANDGDLDVTQYIRIPAADDLADYKFRVAGKETHNRTIDVKTAIFSNVEGYSPAGIVSVANTTDSIVWQDAWDDVSPTGDPYPEALNYMKNQKYVGWVVQTSGNDVTGEYQVERFMQRIELPFDHKQGSNDSVYVKVTHRILPAFTPAMEGVKFYLTNGVNQGGELERVSLQDDATLNFPENNLDHQSTVGIDTIFKFKLDPDIVMPAGTKLYLTTDYMANNRAMYLFETAAENAGYGEGLTGLAKDMSTYLQWGIKLGSVDFATEASGTPVVVNSIQSLGYNTLADYQQGIRNLQNIEDSLKDVINDKYDVPAANLTTMPTDIVSLENDLAAFMKFAEFHATHKKTYLDSLQALIQKAAQARIDAKNFEYTVRQRFLSDNGLLTQVENRLKAFLQELQNRGIEELFIHPTTVRKELVDSVKEGKYGEDRGYWGGFENSDTMKMVLDTLGNPVRLSEADEEEIKLIGKALQITIDAMNSEKANAEAIEVLTDLATAAGDYIKARREGYEVATQTYLNVDPFVTSVDIPALADLVSKPDTANVADGLTADAIEAAETLFDNQLKQLSDTLEAYRSVLNTFSAQGANGEENTIPAQQAAAGEGTLLTKLQAIKDAADQVAADAHDNVVKFVELYKQLNEENWTAGNDDQLKSVVDMWKKFSNDVDTATTATTKEKWELVVKSFLHGEDSLLKADQTPDTIFLANQLVEEYGEFYPNEKDRVTDTTLDGIKDWNKELVKIYAEGRAGESEADSSLVYRTHGEFIKLQDSLNDVKENIRRADQVFLGNYIKQIEIDNQNAWAEVTAAMKDLRETYNEKKDLLQAFRKAAQNNQEVAEQLYHPAALFDQTLYWAANGITNSYNDALANKDAAANVPKVYENGADLTVIATIKDSIETAFGKFLDAFDSNLTLIDTDQFDINPWKIQLEDNDEVLNKVKKHYITADSIECTADSVFADVIKDTVALATALNKDAADLEPKDVETIVNVLNKYADDQFEETMDELLKDAALNDKDRRIDDLDKKLEADSLAFIASYHTEAEDHSHMVADTVWTDLKHQFDSIQAIADSAKLVTLDELPQDRDSMLTYIARYEVALEALKEVAKDAADDYKQKSENADLFWAKRDSIIARIDSAMEAITGAYIEEEFDKKFQEEKDRIANNGVAISGLPKQDSVAITKIDSIRAHVDTMIVAAYNAEALKLSQEFTALYDDYTQIARNLNQALLDAQGALLDNDTPENRQAVADAQQAYHNFTENDDDDNYSYYEKVLDAKTLVEKDIDFPIDSADFADLDTLCSREGTIAELRNYLAATVAGKTVEEFNEQFMDELGDYYDAATGVIEAVAIGSESDYLGYDWKEIQARQKAIDDEMAAVETFIENHPKDIMMYVEQLEARMDDATALAARLADYVEASLDRKAQSDNYKQLFNDYYNAEIAAWVTYAEYAQQGVADVTAFATLNDSVLIDVMRPDLWQNNSLDAIIGTSANIASSQTRQINEYDSLTNIMPLDDVLAITTPSPVLSLGSGRYVPSMTTEQYNAALAYIETQLASNKASIDAYKERAAHAVAIAYVRIGAMAFEAPEGSDNKYLSLWKKRRELVAKAAEAAYDDTKPIMYAASTLDKINALLGNSNDDASMAETSIMGALKALRDSITASFADPKTALADLQNHKDMADDIVKRLQDVEKMFVGKLLGDLNGIVDPTYAGGGDGDITVTDLQILLDIALGKLPMPTVGTDLFAAADIDGNGVIDINDVTCEANFILTGARYYDWDDERIIRYAREANDRSERLSAVLVSSENGQRTYAINLHSDKVYSAFQMDIQLPEGMELISESLTARANGHKLYTNDMEQTHRVLVHQFRNKNLGGNDGAVYTFTVQGEGELNFDNIIFSQSDGHSRAFSIDGTTTGIADKLQNMAVDAKETIYNVGGRVMSSLKKGVNIIRRDNGETEKVVK